MPVANVQLKSDNLRLVMLLLYENWSIRFVVILKIMGRSIRRLLAINLPQN